ncbi:response regulator transcription factor [Panacagrimonas sp.]|uniref:response regulator transcription factor n=1 Tax=Panacagrimonas sp. TaxID=2480088 RepID=UPI003B53029D
MPASPGPASHRLSTRQREVLQLVATGWSSVRIAAHLGLSTRTVENHRAHACRRLGLRGPNALLRWTWQHLDQPAAGPANREIE